MKEICTGDRRYRIHATERHGEWVAYAERADTGDRFGLECAGPSETEAVDRLSRWLGWQYEHAAALADLQAAERAYYRATVDAAFGHQPAGRAAGRGDDQTACLDRPAVALQKASLERMDGERIRLDAIRAREPD